MELDVRDYEYLGKICETVNPIISLMIVMNFLLKSHVKVVSKKNNTNNK